MQLQPSELERLPFHRVEALIKNLKEDNEKENARRKKDEEQQKSKSPDMKTMQRQQKSQMKGMGAGKTPKMPKMR